MSLFLITPLLVFSVMYAICKGPNTLHVIRASPVVQAFAFRNEKWPPSRMQMQTQEKLPLILHSLLLNFRQIVNMNLLLLKLNLIIYRCVFNVHPKHQLIASQTQPVTSQT